MINSAAVRFPDGSVRYGVYDPTVEGMWPLLFETSAEAQGAWDRRDTDADEPSTDDGLPVAEVKIFTDFDGGFWWIAEATKSAITLGATWAGMIGTVEDLEWDDEPRTRHRDVPEWARQALGLPEPTE
jgi:hypothetical protein